MTWLVEPIPTVTVVGEPTQLLTYHTATCPLVLGLVSYPYADCQVW